MDILTTEFIVLPKILNFNSTLMTSGISNSRKHNNSARFEISGAPIDPIQVDNL